MNFQIFYQKIAKILYRMLFELLLYLKKIFLKLAPSKKILILDLLDVEFIKQRIENNAYSNVELLNLSNNLFDLVKSIHAPVYDEDLEKYRKETNKEDLYFPLILRKIVELTSNILKTLEQSREV